MAPAIQDQPTYTADQIELTAEEVLIQYNLMAAPVDLIALAKRMDALLQNCSFKNKDTVLLLAKEAGEVRVLVKSKLSAYSKRFAIAHALGHYLLHYPAQEEYSHLDLERSLIPFASAESSTSTDGRESEANAFARALLMPSRLVRNRSLREPYAKLLIGILIVQILVVNLFFLLIGCKVLEYPPWTANSFIMAVFAEVAAMVLLIVRYLFTSSADKVLDLMVPAKRESRKRLIARRARRT